MGRRVHKKHVVMVADWDLYRYENDGTVKIWVMDVGMDLDDDGTSSVVTDFRPSKGDMPVIKQTSRKSGGHYVWTKVEDE